MRRQRRACRPRSARASTRGAGEEQQPAQIVLGARNFNLSNVTEAWPTQLVCVFTLARSGRVAVWVNKDLKTSEVANL